MIPPDKIWFAEAARRAARKEPRRAEHCLCECNLCVAIRNPDKKLIGKSVYDPADCNNCGHLSYAECPGTNDEVCRMKPPHDKGGK